MKAVIVAVLALVAVCQAGILPLSAGWIGAPAAVSINAAPLGLGGLGLGAPLAAAPLGLGGLGLATPLAAAPIAAAPIAAVHGSASYVSANRGSVHVAPLPGHLIGSKQLNLSPAPGTIW